MLRVVTNIIHDVKIKSNIAAGDKESQIVDTEAEKEKSYVSITDELLFIK